MGAIFGLVYGVGHGGIVESVSGMGGEAGDSAGSSDVGHAGEREGFRATFLFVAGWRLHAVGIRSVRKPRA